MAWIALLKIDSGDSQILVNASTCVKGMKLWQCIHLGLSNIANIKGHWTIKGHWVYNNINIYKGVNLEMHVSGCCPDPGPDCITKYVEELLRPSIIKFIRLLVPSIQWQSWVLVIAFASFINFEQSHMAFRIITVEVLNKFLLIQKCSLCHGHTWYYNLPHEIRCISNNRNLTILIVNLRKVEYSELCC